MIIKILESVRWLLVIAGYILAYFVFNDGPGTVVHYLNPFIIGGIAGFSALEGFFFADRAAREKGYETGSNYQKQTAFWFLSLTIVALLSFFANWGVMADVAISMMFLLFLLFSGINHGWQAIAHGNRTWNNLIRPFGMILLIGLYIYPYSQIF